jgi:hypothetical protein
LKPSIQSLKSKAVRFNEENIKTFCDVFENSRERSFPFAAQSKRSLKMEGFVGFLLLGLLEILSEIIGDAIFDVPSELNHLAGKLNLSLETYFYDEFTKLDLFK